MIDDEGDEGADGEACREHEAEAAPQPGVGDEGEEKEDPSPQGQQGDRGGGPLLREQQ